MNNTAQATPNLATTNLATPVLECRQLSISYFTRAGEIPAVKDFNLVLNAGESIGIVGESGCGKSTVAMAIMRYLGRNGGITGGSLWFQGRDMTRMSEAELARIRGKDIAMVYQEPMSALNPSMTIGAQLAEVPMTHENLSLAEATERAALMLAKVRLPDPKRVLASYPHEISGGQQQRVVIAMALLSNPSLLLLDEPTTALDVTVEAGIVKLIKEISEEAGTSLIYISHNMGLIKETCDRICVMYSGVAVEMGSVSEVFNHMRHPYTRGLLASIPLPAADKNMAPLTPIEGQLPLPHQRPSGCYFGPRCSHFVNNRCDDPAKLSWEVCQPESGHAVRCVRWRELADQAPPNPTPPRPPIAIGEEVLTVSDLSKDYIIQARGFQQWQGAPSRKIIANRDLNFTAHEAETLAIVGESGCGKSTLAKVLIGLEEASDGKAMFLNADIGHLNVTKRSPHHIAGLQMIFQNPNETLNPSHSIGSQIGRSIHRFDKERPRAAIQQRIDELLDMVKLPRAFKNRKPRQLSGGQKQRIGIARAFAGTPRIVIADEPVSALDVSVQAAVTSLLMDIQRDYKTTLLFISHDLSLVRYLADRVMVMYLGRVVEQGTVEQVFAPPYHPYTEALLSAVPIADTRVKKREIVLEGNLPSPLNPPKGCPFATRCPRKIGAICDTTPPPMLVASEAPQTTHHIACHIPLDELRQVAPVIALAHPL